MPLLTDDQLESLLERVEERDPDECWPWSGFTDRNGYPRFSIKKSDGNNTSVVPYRVLWEEEHEGELGELELDHLCRQRDCCNLDHLDPVTRAENNRRMWEEREPVTHCKRGHEFTEENTYMTPDERRQCRACMRLRQKRYEQRRG